MRIIKNKYIKASKSQRSIKSARERYIKLKSKEVQDWDGFWTDYTLYCSPDKDYYFCILGDPDIYNTPEDADWEGESEWEAYEWFDDYEAAGEDDDIFGAEGEDEANEDAGMLQHEQKYSSKNTAINWKYGKLPALFSKVSFQPNTMVLDYGGGAKESAALAQNFFDTNYPDTEYVWYDKYWQNGSQQNEALRRVKSNGGADVALLSNVLNTIAEPEVRHDVLAHIKSLLKPNGVLYIYGYEGNKEQQAGGGRATGEDQYQTFMKTKDYLSEIHEVFPDASIKGGVITARNSNNSVAASIDVNDIVVL